MRLTILAALLAATACAATPPQPEITQNAQSAGAKQLYDEIQRVDARMFDAFNAHILAATLFPRSTQLGVRALPTCQLVDGKGLNNPSE